MSQSIVEVYIHFVWCTEKRRPILGDRLERYNHRRIRTLADELGVAPLAVNSAWNHTHSLFRWRSTTKIARAANLFKAKVARDWNEIRGDSEPRLQWQNGYAAWSVGETNVGAVVDYIAQQKTRHRRDQLVDAYEWS